MINIIRRFFRQLFGYPEIPKNFGFIRDTEDQRDFRFRVTIPKELPTSVDLRPSCPPIYNQGDIGSCTANALGSAFQFEQIKRGGEKNFIPSRLFIYYNERAIEGTINEDGGAMLRTGIKTMVKDGVCPETMWNYVPQSFTSKPPEECYTTALDNQVLTYMRVQQNSLYELKQCLSDGYPIVLGIMLYDSFMSRKVTRTGIIPMPKRNEKSNGGHAVMVVGYDDTKKQFILQNSWGTGWGDKGFFYLPYDYLTNPNLSADYWTIRVVE